MPSYLLLLLSYHPRKPIRTTPQPIIFKDITAIIDCFSDLKDIIPKDAMFVYVSLVLFMNF